LAASARFVNVFDRSERQKPAVARPGPPVARSDRLRFGSLEQRPVTPLRRAAASWRRIRPPSKTAAGHPYAY